MNNNNNLFGYEPALNTNRKRATESTFQIEEFITDPLEHIATVNTVVKFKSNSLIQYDLYKNETNAVRNPNGIRNLIGQNGKSSEYNGYLSPNTKRKIEELLSGWLTCIEQNTNFKNQKQQVNDKIVFPTFITLTLPCSQLHSDNSIKSKVLNPFIEWLRAEPTNIHSTGKLKDMQKGFGVKAYFWRAEAQTNTRIHFHIIVDRFIPWNRIRAKWNQCCERLGYVTFYSLMQKEIFKHGFKLNLTKLEKDKVIIQNQANDILKSGIIPENLNDLFKKVMEDSLKRKKKIDRSTIEQIAIQKQKKVYEKGLECGFTDPNTTDIHSIHNLDSITAYVIKYLSKKPKTKPLETNQELFVNEAINKNCIRTFEIRTNPETNEEEKIIITEDFYSQTFIERKINGRLWGCSDNLRKSKPNENETIEIDDLGRSFIIKQNENIKEQVNAEKIPVANFTYFTRSLQKREIIMSKSKGKINYHSSPPLNENIELRSYINKLIEYCGEDKVLELSNKVGEFFVKNNGRIIPLETKKMNIAPKSRNGKLTQKDALKSLAPIIYNEFNLFHKHNFLILYNPQNEQTNKY